MKAKSKTTSPPTTVLSKTPVQTPVQIKKDTASLSYGTGKRKTSIARLWLKKGSGASKVNSKVVDNYFTRESYKLDITKPLEVVEMKDQLHFNCTVKGGGLSGQAGAIRHALSRALDSLHPAKRKVLRENGLLTRDSRIVERKKYGKRKARKSTQFSKR